MMGRPAPDTGQSQIYVQVGATFHPTLHAKTTVSGADFNSINLKGAVPALQLDDGEVLTEGVAIIQFLADHLRPRGHGSGTRRGASGINEARQHVDRPRK